MSVTNFEDFVQFMMKSNNSNGLTLEKAVDCPNWRESLHRLVAGCYASSSYKSKVKCSKQTSQIQHKRDKAKTKYQDNVIGLTNSVSAYSPVVSLYDVVKFKDTEKVPKKTEFFNYFGLQRTTMNSEDSIFNNTNSVNKNEQSKVFYGSHTINLINSPNVPFSSDIGMKLIKEKNEVSEETHRWKIERLERYLQGTSSVNSDSDSNAPYKVVYNKNIDLDKSHFYQFPTKHFHDKSKLVPKARYILEKYCKPCYVKLSKLDTSKLDQFSSKENKASSEDNQQKENIKMLTNNSTYIENKIVLIDNISAIKEKPSKVVPLKDTSSNTHISLQTTDDELKTLTEKSENKMYAVNNQSINNYENFINACIVLNPINNIINLPNSKSKKIRQKNRGKITNQVVKRRVNTYYPRRFSLRNMTPNKSLVIC